MKPLLLANENVPLPSVEVLRTAGYDVLAIAEAHRGISDQEVLNLAVAQNRWVVTFDRDYGDLIFARKSAPPPALFLLRLRSYRPEDPGYLLIDLLQAPEQLAEQFVVIQEDSIRRRPMPAD